MTLGGDDVGYCDFTEADLRALTRERRRESAQRRRAALPQTTRYACGRDGVYQADRQRLARNRLQMRVWKEGQWNEGNRHCAYCAVHMVRRAGRPNSATVDHVEPLVPGENDHPWNYAMACWACNTRKARMSAAAFRALLAAEAVAIAAE